MAKMKFDLDAVSVEELCRRSALIRRIVAGLRGGIQVSLVADGRVRMVTPLRFKLDRRPDEWLATR